MIQIIGTCTKVETENVTPVDRPAFVSTTYSVMSADGHTRYVRKGRDFVGDEPCEGEEVVLAVWVQPYVSKKTDSLGFQLTAYRRILSASLVASV